METKNYYSVIWLRLTGVFCFLIIVPMVILALVTISNLRDSAVNKIELSLGRLIDHKKEVVDLFLSGKEDLLTMLVGMYPIDYLGRQENLNALFRSVNQQGSIVDLHVIDSSGRQLAYVGPYASSITGKSYHDAQWFQEVLIKGRHVSDVFLGFRNVPHFVVAVTDPLKTYVLRATINSETFNNLLLSSLIGQNGDSFIVNRAGEFQTPSRQGFKQLGVRDRQYLVHHEGTAIEKDIENITATRWVKDGQWCIYVKTRIEDSLGPYYMTRNKVLTTIAATTLVFIVLTVLMASYFLRRLESYDRRRAELGHQMGQMEKMATVGRLAAGIAHEINNPLQMITNQAGWIGELLPDEDPALVRNLDEYQKSIEQIKHHVRRAGTITHRLLGFSRKISAEKQSVQLNDLIEEALSFVEREASYNNIIIVRNFREDLPTTMTDGPQLQQVFLNLINNAIDAVGQGGSLEISTAVDSQGRLVVEFADNGPGIKPENIKQIFDPFFTTKEPGKGTGLGLYISYDIVQKLGGTIQVTNRQSGGAVFTIVLPVIAMG
ncbi:MAG: two-component sensor histidine kinase [Desulfobulbaceae bacterium]|nr:MAG: two-component sensor histidine kinase [Desulfobulbaceae bacterium]